MLPLGIAPHHCPTPRLLLLVATLLAPITVLAQEASAPSQPPSQAPIVREPAQPTTPPPTSQASQQADQQLVPYDPALFQKPVPPAELAFLRQFDGAPADDLIRDKQFRKLLHNAIPSCTFHYGVDKALDDALDEVLKGSREPVQIRDHRYLILSGHNGPYLSGKGFLWVDLNEGILLGAFYFHPTNGEPTPTVNVFSRQVTNQVYLSLSQLPPTFVDDLAEWERRSYIPALTTTYFLTGSNKKVLLEHNEDFCRVGSPAPSGADCRQMNADAADLDMDAASYLDQTHYATNSTAWMINGPDQVAFLAIRANTCGFGPDPLGCRIRLTRERTQVIIHHGPAPHPIHR